MWLSIDGVRVEPAACSGSARAYCRKDGVHELLGPGERLELDFRPPSGAACGDVRLHAHGYYELARPAGP